MTYQMLATKCLKTESMKVYKQLSEHDLCGARKAVSMIVGRDTERLDEEGVAKAAIETVAENASDGVIAPMLYLALFGPVGGFFIRRSTPWIRWWDIKMTDITHLARRRQCWTMLSISFRRASAPCS